ncbi:hypothetical protein HPP92_017957 [Vanilla planifolia]|uniref:Uncharacterized protein n=1 Tax=Vanilla planifolia TaxID=51239 RepID=A0A835QFF5_VANPL|nr:hypothetical protein HPP92_017957 [Vanilla planifolia]
MSSGPRGSAGCLRCLIVIFAVASALCVSGPALYWRFKKGVAGNSASSSGCAPCVCECPPPLSLQKIAPGLLNLTVSDCGRSDPELNKEMEKQYVDLLTEELRLRELVAEENARHMNATVLDAKRLASQYQKEAEKCNIGTETCEEARERAEAGLTREKKLTAYWMRQARALGWKDA